MDIDQRTNPVNILSLEAKDIYLANHLEVKSSIGYSTYRQDGTLNTRRFINTLDYSLDLIKLREVYQSVMRKASGFSYTEGDHEYCPHVINVTFNYSVKDYNLMSRDFYVKLGYTATPSDLTDGVLIRDNQLIAIQLHQQIDSPISSSLLGQHFLYEPHERYYRLNGTLETTMTREDLRYDLYRNGFLCNGIHYVRYKRSSGAARVGKVLFVNESLFTKLHKYDLCGLTFKEGDPIDLAAFESYIALTSSSIIDTIQIDPRSILVIDDYNCEFEHHVIVTTEEGGELVSRLQDTKMSNSIWDGQSLIDISLLGKYRSKGMVLLRNQFFKSCCFNTNIQQWFQDNGITELSQLKGFTLAEDISEVKLITTPSSIKYLKFGKLKDWLNRIDHTFGVVKYDKPTHYFDGRAVQTHYQLINTLQLTKDEMKEFLAPTLDFRKKLRDDPAVMRYYIKFPTGMQLSREPITNKNEIIYNLMGINDNVVHTKYYYDFRKRQLEAFNKNLRRGHVFVNGNYSTLLGNPIEMLQAAIGTFSGESVIGVGNIHSTRFEYNKTLIGSRSPHVTASCIWLPRNTENPLIDRYINLTPQIVCINSINEPTLSRLSGAD